MKQKQIFSIVLISIFILSLISFIPVGNSQIVGSGSIDSGLVCYWRFDENTGTSALDSSGNGKTGTLVNSPNWISNLKYNSGIQFNSSLSQKVTASINLPSPNFTISFWANITSLSASGFDGFFMFGSFPNDLILFYGYGTGSFSIFGLQFRFGVTNLDFGSNILSLNTLNLYTLTYNGSALSYYSNGVLIGYNNTAFVASNNLKLGTADDYGNFKMDDFRLYNRVLSQSEILTLYQGVPITVTHDAGSTVTPNGTVLVGVDQSRTFSVGASNGYVSWTQYINGVATAPLPVVTFSGVQTNQTFYVTSQFTGIYQPTPTPTLTITPTPTPSPSPTPNPTPTPPLYLTGLNFMIVAFILIVVNAVFCFAKIPLLAIPIGFATWIIFFVFSISLDAFNFILIIMALIFASASIILNIKEIRS